MTDFKIKYMEAIIKKRIVSALMEQRVRYEGSDKSFARQYGISSSIYSRLKRGEINGLLKDAQWRSIGQALGVIDDDEKPQWSVVRTEVYEIIEEDILFCKEYSKSRILVEECGIGKSFCARHISRNMKNCFYIDASQAKSKQQFIRLLARTIGVDGEGKYVEVKASIKAHLRSLSKPVVIIDEAGDLDYMAFLELKELWNATEGLCGWYMMGAEGLKAKIERGIRSKRVGFAEIFSRYSEKFTRIVPVDIEQKKQFYSRLIEDVLTVNCDNKALIPGIIRRCLVSHNGTIGGLRRAESLLILAKDRENKEITNKTIKI